jgi:hypothetical protein
MDLLPTHANNTVAAVGVARGDEGVLYNFDCKVSPSSAVGLEGLVEKAEIRWAAEQTDRIVKGEYEVLDGEGERVVLGRGKRSPKAKAKEGAVVESKLEYDDGFELV